MKAKQPPRWDEASLGNTYITDPGHGWYKVHNWAIYLLGIANQISEWSYMDKEYSYLEEDLDMAIYLSAVFRGDKNDIIYYCSKLESDYHQNCYVRNLGKFNAKECIGYGKLQYEVLEKRGFYWDNDTLDSPENYFPFPLAYAYAMGDMHLLEEAVSMDATNAYFMADKKVVMPDYAINSATLHKPCSPIQLMPEYNAEIAMELARHSAAAIKSIGYGWDGEKFVRQPLSLTELKFETYREFVHHVKKGCMVYQHLLSKYIGHDRNGNPYYAPLLMGLFEQTRKAGPYFYISMGKVMGVMGGDGKEPGAMAITYEETAVLLPRSEFSEVTSPGTLTVNGNDNGQFMPVVLYKLYE